MTSLLYLYHMLYTQNQRTKLQKNNDIYKKSRKKLSFLVLLRDFIGNW